MLPVSLEIRNFLAYRSPDPLRFDGIHLACLTGANGAGKSSLLDAITWALWGEARANADELIHQGQSDMQVGLKFKQDGALYEVVRRRKKGSPGTTRLEFYALPPDGERIIRTEGSVRATQAAINRLLRLNYEVFTRSAFLKQGGADAFTKLRPAERKETLSQILGLDRFERYEAAAKKQAQQWEQSVKLLTNQIAEVDAELTREPALQAELAQAQAAHTAAETALKEAEAQFDLVKSVPTDLTNAQTNKTGLEKRLKDAKRDHESAVDDRDRTQKRLREAEALIAQAGEIEAGYAELNAAKETEKALADALNALREVDERIHAAEDAIAKERSALESEASGYRARVATLDEQIAAAQPKALAQLRAEADRLEGIEAQLQEANDTVTALERESVELRTENKTLENEREKLRGRLRKVQRIEGGICPECGQPLTDQHRDELIAAITQEGIAYKTQSEENSARLTALTAAVNEQNAAIEAMRADILRLRRIQQQVAALEKQLESADDAARAANEARAALDAVRARLDARDYAHEAHAALTQAHAERDAIGYDDAMHHETRARLEQLEGFQRRYFELEEARKKLPDHQTDFGSAQMRADRTAAQITELEAERIKLDVAIGALTEQMKTYTARDKQVDDQRKREREALKTMTIKTQELNALGERRKRRAQFEAERAAAREEKAVYDELHFAFGKKGIPAMIIETAIPELESATNALLGRMTNGRMALKLNDQRAKKSGDGVIETLDIEIADEIGTRSYDLYSGGEAFRIDFALRVALSQLLARRAGAQLQTLFVDEGFGTQDDDGRDKLVEAITAIQDVFSLILVITHIDELKDSFPVHIQIVKTSDGSRIAVR